MGNCDKWYTFDFGRGPVDIRCTQTGNHAQCRTEVFHTPENLEAFTNFSPIRKSVFDD